MFRSRRAAALAVCLLLALLHTWPLVLHPGRYSRNDNADTQLNEWIMAWVSHQVVTNPLHLFDANIFYPERYTLAYSDHLFVQSMMGAPLLWGGASPVLVHNLVLMAGFALTGWATCLVMKRWTGSWLAAILSGFHDSKIQDFHEVVIFAVAAEKDVRRFDIPVNETA